MGHFLGLRHTTTFTPSPEVGSVTGTIDDGLADTPRCTSTVDVNKNGSVGFGDGCPDEANLMFYQLSGQTLFTAQQGDTMRSILSRQDH